MKIVFDAADLEELERVDDELTESVAAITSAKSEAEALTAEDLQGLRTFLCEKVLPPLKTVTKWVCKLKFIPGVKKACAILTAVVDILENICD